MSAGKFSDVWNVPYSDERRHAVVLLSAQRLNKSQLVMSGDKENFNEKEGSTGVVKGSRSRLEGMRCSLGQEWSEIDNTCRGRVNAYAWQGTQDSAKELNAKGYARRTNWRLPTARELHSLRDCSKGFFPEDIDLQDGMGSVKEYCVKFPKIPTIGKTIFPNMDMAGDEHRYWTSSPSMKNNSAAWYVSFRLGDVGSGIVNSTETMNFQCV